MEKLVQNEDWQINWSYEGLEWKRFEKWELFRKGGINLLKLIVITLLPATPKKVKINQDKVMIGGKFHPFHTDKRTFQTADIYDVGAMHVLEIWYKKKEVYGVIRVPVPKGKLKDAIMFEKSLHTDSI